MVSEFLLQERVVVFLDDLRTFNERVLLNNCIDSSYMSTSYFTKNEIDELKSIRVDGKTLYSALDDLFKSKKVLCSSHDLYPLYMKYFDINMKNVTKKNIKTYRKSWSVWFELNSHK